MSQQGGQPFSPDQRQLVEQYVNLANKFAWAAVRRYGTSDGFDQEDYQSAAMLGLVQAAKTYREDAGASFMTHASYRIKGAIIDVRRDRLGRRRQDGRILTPKVIPEPLVVGDIREDTSERLIDSDLLPEEQLLALEQSNALHAALWRLDERARYIIERHYIHDQTLHDIATDLGLSASRVGQITKRGINQLRRYLSALQTQN